MPTVDDLALDLDPETNFFLTVIEEFDGCPVRPPHSHRCLPATDYIVLFRQGSIAVEYSLISILLSFTQAT